MLDIDAREELLTALNDYEGAVILISHDRRLIEATMDPGCCWWPMAACIRSTAIWTTIAVSSLTGDNVPRAQRRKSRSAARAEEGFQRRCPSRSRRTPQATQAAEGQGRSGGASGSPRSPQRSLRNSDRARSPIRCCLRTIRRKAKPFPRSAPTPRAALPRPKHAGSPSTKNTKRRRKPTLERRLKPPTLLSRRRGDFACRLSTM